MQINLENFTWDEENLSEIFAIPIGLKPVATVSGEQLYGSERLNQTFLKAMSKNGRMKPVIATLTKLVQEGKINPVFYDKGILKFAAWKIFAPMNQKYTSAFYWLKGKKIFLNLSNTANFFAAMPNESAAKILMHEMVHMLAHINNAAFINIWMEDLIKYYTEVYSMLLKINKKDIPNKFVKDNILKLTRTIDTYKKSQGPVIINYRKQLLTLAPKSSLSREDYEQMVNGYISLGVLVLFKSKAWAQNLQKFKPFIDILEYAYHRAFNVSYIDVICSQEILIPSEVAAVCTAYPQFLKKGQLTVKKL